MLPTGSGFSNWELPACDGRSLLGLARGPRETFTGAIIGTGLIIVHGVDRSSRSALRARCSSPKHRFAVLAERLRRLDSGLGLPVLRSFWSP